MNQADKGRVESFLSKWLGSEGNERANYQGFFLDLCEALGVEKPLPKGNAADAPYCFDKDIKFYSSKKTAPTTRFADFYKEGCFLIEAKQGSEKSSKGHGKRGTKVYRDEMQKAFNQARQYAGMLTARPPFLLTCDIGSHFELWEGFSGEYGSYGARQTINLKDLADAEVFDRFVKIFVDPQALNPEKLRARVTREVAAELARLSRWMEEQGHDPQKTASFLMRCIFTMFAEDVGLLKEDVFTKALRDRWIVNPADFQPQIEELWQKMNTGGTFGYDRILRFNGSFFEDATAFALPKEQLEILYAAAAKDWSLVEPAIFGTLVERALEKKERSRLGAHYTPRSYVERLVRPVVMEPLRQEWDEIELEVQRLLTPEKDKTEATAKQQKAAEQEIRTFLDKLREIKILDPACGTGNFLYVSLDLMKGLEQEVLKRLEDVAGTVQLEIKQINPSQFLGIEINPRAAAIAELVIWIGYLQWYFKRFGNAEPPEPVLQAFGNIECRDAVLAYDGKVPDVDEKTGEVRTRWGGRMMTHPVTGEEVPDPESQVVIYQYLNARAAEWPEADYVVSNPPFIGNFKMRELLGDGYAESLRMVYSRLIPETADFVMFWWHKVATAVRELKLTKFGLITTNSIRQIHQRKVIEYHLRQKQPIRIPFAIPDHPWVDQGAGVRIAMTTGEMDTNQTLPRSAVLGTVNREVEGVSPEDSADAIVVSFEAVDRIFSNLEAGTDLTSTIKLRSNSLLAGPGVKLHGSGFLVESQELKSWNKDSISNVVKTYVNGKDLAQHDRRISVIDFFGLSLSESQRYKEPFNKILEEVKPERDVNKRKSRKENWWLFGENVLKTRNSIAGLARYIATPETTKHRVFIFLDSDVLPDNMVTAIAFEDAYHLGILSSSIHVVWSLATGGDLGGNTPRYNKTVCFDPFPFPNPSLEQKQKIRELGDRLDTHRKQVQAAHPEITITGMYNLLEKLRAGQPFTDADRDYNNKALVSILKQIHDDLDRAVLDAYGWPQTITDEQILEKLVALNAERAEEERNGLIRWLRPEYQAPNEIVETQPTLEGIITQEEPIIEPVEQQKWPAKPKDQLAAIRDLLRTTPGEWTTQQIAAQFKGNITKKKIEAITENLERLEWFGLIIAETKGDLPYWHYAENLERLE